MEAIQGTSLSLLLVKAYEYCHAFVGRHERSASCIPFRDDPSYGVAINIILTYMKVADMVERMDRSHRKNYEGLW